MFESESYAKAEFFRKPNFSEYFPKFPNCWFNTRNDNREVTLTEFFESRICPNIYRMFRHYDSLRAKKDILKNFFGYLMMTNVMVKTCLKQKIMKNCNFIQAIKISVCPTANVTRRPIFSESRIFPSFRIVDWTHDMIIVKWHLLNFSKAEFVRIFTECLPNVPKCGLNTRHDNREVTLIHLTRAQTLRSDKCATGSIHANESMTINVIPC